MNRFAATLSETPASEEYTQRSWLLGGRYRTKLTFAAAAVFGIAARLLFAHNLPLWFDETFTAVIAARPSFPFLVRWCLTELTGSAYYMPMWLWAQAAGSSDTALRLPGLMMAVVAPAILAWRSHPNRELRLIWVTLAFLSTPMIVVATEARPYL